MQVVDLGANVKFLNLLPGDLFAYSVDADVGLAIRLKDDIRGYAAVTLTHSPGQSKRLPSLITKAYFEHSVSELVFRYKEPTISANQNYKSLKFTSPPDNGAIISLEDRTMLRCYRDQFRFDIDLRTGELLDTDGNGEFWTTDWVIRDWLGNSVLQNGSPP